MLKRNYFIGRPNSATRMQFSKEKLDTNDDIARVITIGNQIHDIAWVLDERPDGEQLAAFWTKVRDEARENPSWNFADESDS